MARYSSPLVAHMVNGVLIALAYFNLPQGCSSREVRDLSRRARNWAVRYYQTNPNLVTVGRFTDIPQYPNVAMRHPTIFRRDVPKFIRLATKDAGEMTGLPGYVPAANLRMNPFPKPAPVPGLAGPLDEIYTSRAVRSYLASRGQVQRDPLPVKIEHLSAADRVLYNWLPEFLIALGALHRR